MTTTTGAGWATAVRARLGLGRLLPLGEAADGAWLAERAARAVLLRAATAVRGVAPGLLRVGLAGGGAAGEAPFPVPPGGLPPGPLRITAEFTATPERPLPVLAEEVREALFAAAVAELGLMVVEVDLRVTGLVEELPATGPAEGGDGSSDAPVSAHPPGGTSATAEDPASKKSATKDPAGLAALTVEGVAALTDVLGTPVHRAPGLLRVEVAVTAGHRALDVARSVRTAVTATVTATAPEATAVTVLVSEIR
ncbi:hypothetical protein J7E93_19985 [Streptomyces sp. ISL-36]|uniref:hypothetical protein n=1 Tax=Streptomyces sp. ISL-36 TaxID=2819182 RepID=UPI001BE7995C|nr:hypothetical protein [Streptomyces sp. ISL-36]MBT2442346.1 hypothetical protein [Streptomyces sp. ISL-36]